MGGKLLHIYTKTPKWFCFGKFLRRHKTINIMTKTHPMIDAKFYPLIKFISFAIRYLICYFTIEAIPIFESKTAQKVWNALFGGIIYTVFLGICYPLVGCISKRNNINSNSTKSILYFILYLPLILIAYIVLLSLTHCGVLPISHEITFSLKEFAFNIIVWFAESFQNIILFLWNWVVSIIDGIAKM